MEKPKISPAAHILPNQPEIIQPRHKKGKSVPPNLRNGNSNNIRQVDEDIELGPNTTTSGLTNG